MEVELPREVTSQLAGFDACLGKLEVTLKPFLGARVKELDAQLEPLQRAQLHLALAQAAAGLFQLYLRASGADPADHGMAKEQERLAAVGKRVRKAVAEKELSESRPTLAMDVAGVNRFINAAIGSELTRQQKQALLSVPASGSKRKQQQESGTAGSAADAEAAAEADAFLAGMAADVTPGTAAAAVQRDAGGSSGKKKKSKKAKGHAGS